MKEGIFIITNSVSSVNPINADLAGKILPRRSDRGHKGTFDTLLCFCGSQDMPGAAQLSAHAALRCGVGLLRLASVPTVLSLVQHNQSEAVCVPMPENEAGQMRYDPRQPLWRDLRASASLIGCGLGKSEDGRALLAHLIEKTDNPLVIDADGLNLLTPALLDMIRTRTAPVLLTPHIGEMTRLALQPKDVILRDRFALCRDFAEKYHVHLVLKDYITLLTTPDGAQYLLDAPNGGLAKGGSGDVLAGCIAAFLAQRFPPDAAAILGIYLHSRAGALARAKLGAYSMLPRDVIDCLPQAFMELE